MKSAEINIKSSKNTNIFKSLKKFESLLTSELLNKILKFCEFTKLHKWISIYIHLNVLILELYNKSFLLLHNVNYIIVYIHYETILKNIL